MFVVLLYGVTETMVSLGMWNSRILQWVPKRERSFCCRKRFLFNMNNVSNTHSSYKTYAHGVSFKKSEHELLLFFFGKIVFIFLNLLLHNVKIIKRFFFFHPNTQRKAGINVCR